MEENWPNLLFNNLECFIVHFLSGLRDFSFLLACIESQWIFKMYSFVFYLAGLRVYYVRTYLPTYLFTYLYIYLPSSLPLLVYT